MTIAPGDKIYFKGGDFFEGNITIDQNDANDPSNPVLFTSYGSGRATIHTAGTTLNGFKAKNTQGVTITNLNFVGDGNRFVAEANSGILFESTLTGSSKLSTFEVRNVEVSKFAYIGIYLHQKGGIDAGGFKKIIIDSAKVHDVKETGIAIYCEQESQYSSSWHVRNVKVTNCETYKIPGYSSNIHKGSGIILSQIDSCVIERCLSYQNGAQNSNKGGPGGIWVYSANNTIIQNCESHHNSSGTGGDGLGFDLDGGCTNCVIQYCYSHDNDGAGYLLGQYSNARPWANNIVRYNISENDSRTNHSPITLFKGDNCEFDGVQIYNNTVYASPSTSVIGPPLAIFELSEWVSGMQGIVAYNNIFVSKDGVPMVSIPSSYYAKLCGNLYWASGEKVSINYHGTEYTNLKSWADACGNEKIGNKYTGIIADPKLNNPGTSRLLFPKTNKELNEYRLADGSPAIGSGLNLDSLFHINIGTHDYYGTIIAPKSSHNIGAFETEQGLSIFKPSVQKLTILEISPNPSNGNFKIEFDNDENSSASATISDITGRIVDTRTTSDSFIRYADMNLTEGIYYITVTAMNKTFIGKLIVRQ
jgi:hypothetical protein